MGDQPERFWLGKVENPGEPIRLHGVNLCGVAATSAKEGETVSVWTRLSLTSDHPTFHRIVDNIVSSLDHWVQQAGAAAKLRAAHTILLVARPDNTAELWIDTAAVTLFVIVKRAIAAGSPVFDRDVADVTGMDFPVVDIAAEDRMLCLFRKDWRFALYFDLEHEQSLDRSFMRRELGRLYRNLAYRHHYDAVADTNVFPALIAAGWFPFVEILGAEFRSLVSACEADFPLSDAETAILKSFDDERLKRISDRWAAHPHFQPQESLFKAALAAFQRAEPHAVIKIILTEIEGVLRGAYRSRQGKSAKLKELLLFAQAAAEQKVGAPDTLLFPEAFATYLREYTFANFDPDGPPGSAGSRHAVGHGAAEAQSYTMMRALQAILTLDQIAFAT